MAVSRHLTTSPLLEHLFRSVTLTGACLLVGAGMRRPWGPFLGDVWLSGRWQEGGGSPRLLSTAHQDSSWAVGSTTSMRTDCGKMGHCLLAQTHMRMSLLL